MRLDYLCQLSSDQAITGSTDANTENVYDLGNVTPKRRVGAGPPLSIVFIVKAAASADGGSFTDTCDFLAIEDAAENLGTRTTIIQRRLPAAELVVGKVVEVPLPSDRPLKRYLAGRVEFGNDDGITVDAYIVPRDTVPAWLAYADNIVP